MSDGNGVFPHGAHRARPLLLLACVAAITAAAQLTGSLSDPARGRRQRHRLRSRRARRPARPGSRPADPPAAAAFDTAHFSSVRDLRESVRAFTLSALGLVMLTAAMVGVVAHAAVDGLPWTVAIALGRSSPSRILLAATTITRRVRDPEPPDGGHRGREPRQRRLGARAREHRGGRDDRRIVRRARRPRATSPSASWAKSPRTHPAEVLAAVTVALLVGGAHQHSRPPSPRASGRAGACDVYVSAGLPTRHGPSSCSVSSHRWASARPSSISSSMNSLARNR